MKKILTIIIILFLIPLVNAQEIEEDAGITPDSWVWGIDRALERVRMIFTFGKENKINYGLKIAEERLAEIKEMARQNKVVGLEKAQLSRERIINRIQERTNEIENGEQIRARVEEKLQKHIEVLERVKEEAPEQAQEGLTNAIEKSSQVLERIKGN